MLLNNHHYFRLRKNFQFPRDKIERPIGLDLDK